MDISQIRKDTLHCEDKLFLNSAGASLMPRVVIQKSHEYLLEEEKLGGYKVAALKGDEIDGFYSETAKLLNCRADQIAFAANATDAYSKALSAIPFKENDVILTTDDDYVSNHIGFLSLQKRFGIQIVKAQNTEDGDLDLTDFENKIKEHAPKLVAVTHIPTNSGLVQDVESIGSLCQKYEILYLVDACQSVGQIPVDVQKIKCDFLSATGRKFLRGPRGTGFLYASDKILQSDLAPLFMDLRGATWDQRDHYEIMKTAKRFELWELPYPFVIGMREAVKYANDIGLEAIEERNQQLLDRLSENMKVINGIVRYDRGSVLSNIFTFRKAGVSKEQMIGHLDTHKVFYSISQVDNARIDFEKKGIDWAVRISPHYFNTFQEIDQFCEIVASVS
ncbi:MAG: aminotransferase class V-fold PLP-dependent enzyme [Bacteroidota bacterium]